MKFYKLYEDFNDMVVYDNAAKGILDYYIKNYDEMTDDKRSHFIWRATVTYGRLWKDKLYKSNLFLIKNLEANWKSYQNDNFDKKMDSLKNAGGNVDDTGIYTQKKNLYPGVNQRSNDWSVKHFPMSAAERGYGDILNDYSALWRMGQLKHVKESKEICKWLEERFMKYWKWIVKNPSIIWSNPVHVVNFAYHGLELNFVDQNTIMDMEDQIADMIKTEFDKPIKEMDALDFNNYIYALTHIIIGASGYYYRKLPHYKQRYGWIIDIFDKNEKRIMETSDDLTAEMGIIYVLCGLETRANVYRKEILNRIDKDKGIIISENTDGDINLCEHTNALAMMTLHGLKFQMNI